MKRFKKNQIDCGSSKRFLCCISVNISIAYFKNTIWFYNEITIKNFIYIAHINVATCIPISSNFSGSNNSTSTCQRIVIRITESFEKLSLTMQLFTNNTRRFDAHDTEGYIEHIIVEHNNLYLIRNIYKVNQKRRACRNVTIFVCRNKNSRIIGKFPLNQFQLSLVQSPKNIQILLRRQINKIIILSWI